MGKFLANISIIIASIIAVIIALFFINDMVSGCKEEVHTFINETNTCYYNATTCQEGEVKGIVDEKNVCIYDAGGFINTSIMKYILIFLGIGWLIMIIIFIIIKFSGKKGTSDGKPIEVSEFKKKDFLHPKKALEIFEQTWSQRYNVNMVNGKPPKGVFIYYHKAEPTQKGREWFFKFQVEILEGDYPGVFTVILSMSRGKEWIEGWNFSWDECSYDEYKRARDWPLFTPTDARDRLLESLYERHPEKAIQLQQEMIEREIQTPSVLPELQSDQRTQLTAVRPPIRPRYPTYRRARYR